MVIGVISVVMVYSFMVVGVFFLGKMCSSRVCDSGISGFLVRFCMMWKVISMFSELVRLYSVENSLNMIIDRMNMCIVLK